MSGVPVAPREILAYVLSGLLAAIGGLFLTFVTYSGEASAANGGSYTLYSIAAVVLGGVSLLRRLGQRDRRDLRRADVPHHRRPAVRVRSRSAVAAAVSGRSCCSPRCASAPRGCSRSATGWSCSHERERTEIGATALLRDAIDPAVAIAFGCIVALLLLGSLYSRSFLSPEYLLQQLKVASFLGVIATGMMIVILLGQIDLSRALGGRGRRHDVDGGDRLGAGRATRSPFRSASPAASRSGSSTASASPICASPR